METCKSYHEIVSERKPTEFERGFYLAKTGKYPATVTETKAYCYGTKECEECKCGGDRHKCDFYPENRKPET